MPPPKQRTPQLRDHLLHVAVAVLEREGVASFTTRRLAQQAGTSPPAVYELFGDKAGLVREVFFEGFRMLRRRFDELDETDDPRADLEALVQEFRVFLRENPVLAQIMFLRRLSDLDPGPEESGAGAAVRTFIVGRVRRCLEAGVLQGDATDIAHVLVSSTQGLAATEIAGWLGTSQASVDRRWALAVRAMLDGLQPAKRRAGRATAPKLGRR